MSEEIAVRDEPTPAAAPADESLYGPAEVEKEAVADNTMTVREEAPKDGNERSEEKKAEERVYANKYKTADELEKAYNELNKKFRRGDSKPIEDGYKYDKIEAAGIPEDDPLLQGFNKLALERGMSKDDYHALVDTFLDAVGAQEELTKQTRAEIMADLGPSAENIVKDMGQWAQGLLKSGVWSGEEYAWFVLAADSAVGTRALMKIRESYADRIPFKAAPTPGSDKITKMELDQMVADPRYFSDPIYREQVNRKAEASFG